MGLKEMELGNFDQYQMDNMSFDVEKQAWRMTLVDGSVQLNSTAAPEQKVLEIPVIIKEIDVRQVNVPVIIKETQIIEIPKIITEYKTIEVPVIVREVQVVEIEKPVVIKEVELKVIEKLIPTMPKAAQICMFIQAVANVTLLLMYILKGK